MVDIPPILECALESCRKGFFKTRSDRDFCSEKCARKQWYLDVSSGKRRPRRRKKQEVVVGAPAETN